MHFDDKVSSLSNTESQSPPLTLADLVRDAAIHRGLHRIAESRARLPRGSPDAEDLVSGVIADLAADQIAPDLPNLRSQAIRLVRQRADKYERDSQKSVTCYLDEAPPEAMADRAGESEDAAEIEPARDPGAIARAVGELAADDPPVLQLLDLYERGFTRRRDALSIGMSKAVYRTARERLTAYGQRARSLLEPAGARINVEAAQHDGHRQSRVARNATHQTNKRAQPGEHRSA